MDVFATGLSLGESPRWHDGRLWVCDWLAGHVLSFGPGGDSRVELTVTGMPFSVDWLPDGRAVLTGPQGVTTADGEHYGAAPELWNEIVVHPRGDVYINTIGFDLGAGEDPKPGSVHLVRPDGSSQQVAGDLAFPNGMAITPDGRTLIVAESYAPCLTAFEIGEDGALSGRRVWAPLDDAPDGICLDQDGAAWVASVPGRNCLRVAEGGEVLDRADTGVGCFAVMLGGDDGRTLFAVATEWNGMDSFDPGTGRILTRRAPAPRAGRP
jgi:sugar lactone lactonase YvrE